MHKAKVLIVDDDRDFVVDLMMLLEDRFSCQAVGSGDRGLAVLGEQDVDLLLLDIDLGQGMNGFDVLRQLKASGSSLPVVMITKDDSAPTVVQAMKMGAHDFVGKTPSKIDLEMTLDRALRETQLERENQVYRREIQRLVGNWDLLGDSAAMLDLRLKVSKIAPTDFPVLISGENGTGKELVARAINANSLRKDKPLITVNCRGVPSTLIESELFGHEKGAFSGAVQRKLGQFELANQGTIFLDEIGELSLDAQATLLRVLENGEVKRIGGTTTRQVDVRVLAASNRDLREGVRTGTFREDLYYRLAVTSIHVPRLADRKADIPLLAAAFLAREACQVARTVSGFNPAALATLVAYDWPGNVRELLNVVRNAIIFAEGPIITEEELPTHIRLNAGIALYEQAKEKAMGKFEREYWSALYRLCNGNKSQMARTAGISRQGLDKILKSYHLLDAFEETCVPPLRAEPTADPC